MSRTIIIGDLHGCYEETVQLLDKLKVRAEDRVIFLGDLVDRGPENAKCVDLVMHRQAVQGSIACVLGNHEEKHLFYDDIEKRKGRVNVDISTHTATRAQLRPEHYDYFRTLPLYIRLPEFNAICVHAGMFPGRTIEQQTTKHLLHIQMIKPWDYDEHGRMVLNEKSMWPSKCVDKPGWKFWTNFWTGPERIIFGHSVLDKPLVTEHVVGLDGGAVFGRDLHALVLPSWEIVSVKGKHDHGKGVRGRPSEEEVLRGARIGAYPIHGDVSTFS